MKKFFVLGFATLLCSCSNKEKKIEETTALPEAPVAVSVVEEEKDADQIEEISRKSHSEVVADSTLRNTVERLRSKYANVSYYFEYEADRYFIVGQSKRTDTSLKFGMADADARLLLEAEFDKIYNPDVTLIKCMEVRQSDKLGLFNYAENVLLEPQFEYIVPEDGDYVQVAFGIKDGDWYKIEFDGGFKVTECQYDFVETLRALDYSSSIFQNRPLINISTVLGETEYAQYTGNGVAITPSYIERLGVVPKISQDLILREQGADVGLEELTLSYVDHSSLRNRITSFIVNLYESNFDARGYTEEQKALVVFNNSTQEAQSQVLNSLNKEYFCQEEKIVHINDTLIEVQSTQISNSLYDWESNFSYYTILPSGEIEHLTSNRNFDASKFTKLEERHFKGCFGKSMTPEEREQLSDEEHYQSVWRSEHLSIADLDIMRNEIFAEYGYTFSTEKWHNYFSQFAWYRPTFDNVDDQLTETDKANIKTIVELKEKMLSGEQEFTKKKAVGYSAPG